MRKLVVIFVLFMLLWGSDFQALFKEGEKYYKKALAGDKEAVDKAVEFLEKALKLNPKSALAMAYLGSAYTLKGRDAPRPWDKMKFTKKGIALLDKAVRLDPENIRVRLERGINSLALPEFFGRLNVAKEDFDFLLKKAEKGELPSDLSQFIYYQSGRVYFKLGDYQRAASLWEKAVKINEKSEYGRKAKEELSKLED